MTEIKNSILIASALATEGPHCLLVVSASFARFEPFESHAMHREVAVTWLAYLVALGRPNSDPEGIFRPIATAQEDSHI